MTNEPEIRELRAQPAVVRRAETEPDRIAAVVDEGYPALFGQLAAAGVAPAAPPFLRYLRIGPTFELELGVPIESSAPEIDGAERVSLPAGRAAVLQHVGSYQGLEESSTRLLRWIEERGERPGGPHWETYMTDPRSEPDTSKWITEIVVPLA